MVNRPFKIGVAGLFQSIGESTDNQDIRPGILHEPFGEVDYGGFGLLRAT